MNKRHFFLSYISDRNDIGNFSFTSFDGKFANMKTIIPQIKKSLNLHPDTKVIITGIFEFKSQEDYENWINPDAKLTITD